MKNRTIELLERATEVASAPFSYVPTRHVENAVIRVKDLRKIYSGTPAVDGVSFEVEKGEIFGLLGPNGAGKTTTVEMIEGLRTTDSGSISILGMDQAKNPQQIKEQIGIQLQIPSLLPLLNVEEIIDLFGGVYKKCLPTKQLIKMVSLDDSSKVLSKNLSGGQAQRLSVAMALVNDPQIVFLDEPSTGLDPQARRNLWSVIEEMREQGKTIILTTHFMEEAEKLCDRLVIMDQGRIVAEGGPQELIDTYFKESAIQFEADISIPLELFKGLPGVIDAARDNNEVVVYSNDVQTTIAEILRLAQTNGTSGKLKNLHVRQSTLEDVFLKITGRRIRN